MKVKVSINIPPLIPIRIGGSKAQKEVDALVDTGSTYLVISWENALDMGYDQQRPRVSQLQLQVV